MWAAVPTTRPPRPTTLHSTSLHKSSDWKVRKDSALVVADQLTVERPLPRTSAVEGGAWSGVKRKAADLDGGGWWALVPLVSVVVGKRSGQGGLLCPPPGHHLPPPYTQRAYIRAATGKRWVVGAGAPGLSGGG